MDAHRFLTDAEDRGDLAFLYDPVRAEDPLVEAAWDRVRPGGWVSALA